LTVHPNMGWVVLEFDQSFLRELIHTPFRIVYRRDPKRVRVVRVWCGKCLLQLPAADEEAPSKTRESRRAIRKIDD
jgi:plasmid stabilization system protein ParE